MDAIQYAIMTDPSTELLRSALPDAPVVPYVAPVLRTRRTRGALATTLHRLGDAVAPTAAGSAAH